MHAQAAPQPAGADTAQVERGAYLARAGDCSGCHTTDGGQPFAGGFAVETGFGTIYTPNITPDKETGIGGWSADDFWRAMHHGVDDEGKHLYPAFPYPWFTKVTRADVDALKAFLDTVPPVRRQNKPPQLPWWMSWRFSLVGWNLFWFDEGVFKPDPTQSEQWNRGAYLVEGLGHCGDCHTPKSYFGGADADQRLAGGYTEGGHDNGWFSPALTNSRRGGLADWSVDDIARYLKTGSNARTAAAGPMVEVIEHSTRHLSEADLTAMAVYLKSQPPRADATPVTPLGGPHWNAARRCSPTTAPRATCTTVVAYATSFPRWRAVRRSRRARRRRCCASCWTAPRSPHSRASAPSWRCPASPTS